MLSHSQFSETIASEDATGLLEDGFAEVVSTLIADYDSGVMPKPGDEDFISAFKKYIKVTARISDRSFKLFHQLPGHQPCFSRKLTARQCFANLDGTFALLCSTVSVS